jgi:hypothetical protein
MLNGWVDPHNGGKYSLFTNTSTSVTGMRLTGSNGPAEPYVDHWDITFTPVGRDPTKCEVGQRASPSCSPVTSPSFIHPLLLQFHSQPAETVVAATSSAWSPPSVLPHTHTHTTIQSRVVHHSGEIVWETSPSIEVTLLWRHPPQSSQFTPMPCSILCTTVTPTRLRRNHTSRASATHAQTVISHRYRPAAYHKRCLSSIFRPTTAMSGICK